MGFFKKYGILQHFMGFYRVCLGAYHGLYSFLAFVVGIANVMEFFNTCWLRTGFPQWMIIPNILDSIIPYHHKPTGVSWRHCSIGISSTELMNRPLKS
jgi:hypothetical protein